MSSSDAELTVAYQACREVISCMKHSEIVCPHGGISIREQSNYRLVSNSTTKWVLASTLRGVSQTQKSLQAGDVDEKYQLDRVTEVLISRMTLLIVGSTVQLVSTNEVTSVGCPQRETFAFR